MKVVRLSPLRTGRLHPQEFSWYSFLEAESETRAHGSVGSFGKIPSDTTGDRSRDLPTSKCVGVVDKETGDKVEACGARMHMLVHTHHPRH
jgi:hypothetical protein